MADTYLTKKTVDEIGARAYDVYINDELFATVYQRREYFAGGYYPTGRWYYVAVDGHRGRAYSKVQQAWNDVFAYYRKLHPLTEGA